MKPLFVIACFVLSSACFAGQPLTEQAKAYTWQPGTMAPDGTLITAIDRDHSQRNLWLMDVAFMASMFSDYETTFRAKSHGAHEANPFMAPLINRGRAVTYGVMIPMHLGIMALTHRWQHTGRHLYWLPQFVLTVEHGTFAAWNYHF